MGNRFAASGRDALALKAIGTGNGCVRARDEGEGTAAAAVGTGVLR